jgi:hypothetical protein
MGFKLFNNEVLIATMTSVEIIAAITRRSGAYHLCN